MENEAKGRVLRPWAKKAIVALAVVGIAMTTVPALGLLLAYVLLLAPVLVPFLLLGGGNSERPHVEQT